MTATLTDRYVAATLRRVPEKQRTEIEKELRAAIADDVDARTDRGGTAAAAEYAALAEMGDPYRLAASYTGRVLTLIGPDLYPTFVRSLKIVCWSALPVVFVVLAIISFAQGKNVWGSIFGPLGTTISVGIYISFVVTLLFALVERGLTRPSADPSHLAWTPDSLSVEIDPPRLSKWGDVLSQIVGTMIIVAFLLVDRFAPFVTSTAGHAVPVLDQQLWRVWIPIFLVLLAIAIAIEFVKLRAGRWTYGIAIAETVLGVLGTGTIITMVLSATVVNPALAATPIVAAGSWVWWIVATVVGLVWLGTTINLWRPSARTR